MFDYVEFIEDLKTDANGKFRKYSSNIFVNAEETMSSIKGLMRTIAGLHVALMIMSKVFSVKHKRQT